MRLHQQMHLFKKYERGMVLECPEGQKQSFKPVLMIIRIRFSVVFVVIIER